MYQYKKEVNLNYLEAIKKVKSELEKEGFGVITEINVKETFKKKLDIDFENYSILGACNPNFAYKALQAEMDLGLMLPCNLIVYTLKNKTYVAAINPSVQMEKIGNSLLKEIGPAVEEKLKKVIDSI